MYRTHISIIPPNLPLKKEGREDFIHTQKYNLFRAGFTLLEVLIALAIVGSLLVTVIYTLNYNLGIVDKHETITVATLLAKEKMADLGKNPVDKKGNFDNPYENYIYETSVKDSPYAGISEIIVIVKTGNEEVKLNEFIFK